MWAVFFGCFLLPVRKRLIRDGSTEMPWASSLLEVCVIFIRNTNLSLNCIFPPWMIIWKCNFIHDITQYKHHIKNTQKITNSITRQQGTLPKSKQHKLEIYHMLFTMPTKEINSLFSTTTYLHHCRLRIEHFWFPILQVV